MSATATKIVVKSLDEPDETRPTADRGRVDIVTLGEVMVGRSTFEPGWRWSEHVAPIAHTDLCQIAHTGYVISGRMAVRLADGSEAVVSAGDAILIPPGHDAWVIGEVPCVTVDFTGIENFAKP